MAAAAMLFVVCLWIGRAVSFSWMPRAEADRWVVATAFATVMATGAFGAVAWWAGRETPAGHASQSVRGTAVAGGIAQVSQTGGNVRIVHRGPTAGSTSAPPSVSGPVTSEEGGQSVRDTTTAGPVNQVQGTGGDVEIESL